MSVKKQGDSQRVAVTYTVDLSEVPERVQLLLNELGNSFTGIGNLCKKASKTMAEDTVQGTRELVQLKDIVGKSEIRVTDCINMMLGYFDIIGIPKQPEPEPKKEVSSKKKKTTKKKTTKKKTTKKKKTKKEEE